MASREAAAAALRALRSPCRLSSRGLASWWSLGRSRFDGNGLHAKCPSALPFYCPPSWSSSAFTHFRLFSADAAAVSSKVIMVKDDKHYADVMKEIKGKETLAVVYFTAQWCGPCKQISPYIDQLSHQFDDVTFLKINVDELELEETMKNSSIGVVPTFHFHKKGELIGELTGAVKDKLKLLVESLRSKS